MRNALAARFPLLNELLTQRIAPMLWLATGVVFAMNAGMFAHLIATSQNLITIYGPVVGGDFVVFHTAAQAALSGAGGEIYEAANLAERLKAAFPDIPGTLLFWQYPPTMLALVAPFGLLPYLAGYAAWAGAGGALCVTAFRPILSSPLALFCVIASPAAIQALATGQTGFFTAGLLALAAFNAERRPLLAGLAAGLLTFKPQLGLLVPIAFAAAGAWRAFGVAALVAALMAALTTAAFGPDVWTAFLNGFSDVSGRLQSDVFPFKKLLSVYGGFVMMGAPQSAAMTLQIAATVSLAAFTFLLWRRVAAPDLRLATLCAAALLAAPNAFHYELPLTLPALLVVARRGVETGWLAGERPLLVAAWIAPIFIVGSDGPPGLPIGFLTALAAFALAVRRAFAAGRPAC